MSKRFFRHGELPLVLLALLSEAPRHGYEIMGELTRLFGPRYHPSPGSVYPAIDALEGEGLIAGEARAGRTIYRTTPAGAAALAQRSDALAALELRTETRLGQADAIEPLIARFKARVLPISRRVDPQAVASILERAAAEIESLNGSQQRSASDE